MIVLLGFHMRKGTVLAMFTLSMYTYYLKNSTSLMGHVIYCLTHTRLDVFVVCLFRLLTRLGTALSPCDSSISVWDHGTERM